MRDELFLFSCNTKNTPTGSGYMILGLGGEQRVLEYQYINLSGPMGLLVKSS